MSVAARIALAMVLIAAPLPVWRYVAWFARRGRRSLNAAVLAVVLAVYVAIVVWSAQAWAPLAGVGGVVAVFVGLGVLAGRATSGSRFGLPPGPLEILPTGAFCDPELLARRAETFGPVFKIAGTLPTPRLRPTVCIVGLDRGLTLLRDHDEDLVAPPLPTSRAVPTGFVRNMTSADHDVYAPVFRAAAASWTGELPADPLDRAMRQIVATLSGAGPAGVHPEAVVRAGVHAVLARSVLGLLDDTDISALRHAIDRIERGARRWKPDRPRERAFAEAIELVTSAAGRSDADAFLRRALAIRPTGADEPTIVGNAVQMVAQSTTDVSALVTWLFHEIGVDPTLSRDVARAARSGDGSALDAVVSELLRLRQSEYILRTVRRGFRFDGHRFPRGWTVRICTRESHRLAAHFDHPDRFDPRRFAADPPDRTRYAPFGLGRHRCIGGTLTHRIATNVMRATFSEHDIDVVSDGPVEHGPNHWTPSRRFRMRLVPRADGNLTDGSPRDPDT